MHECTCIHSQETVNQAAMTDRKQRPLWSESDPPPAAHVDPPAPIELRLREDKNVVAQLMLTGISLLGSALAMKWVMSSIDPNKDAKNKAKKRKEEIQKRLGRRITLDGLEFNIALCVINPAHIDTTLADIGGLDDVANALMNRVLAPLTQPELFQSTLLRLPRGVLLHGPPGTGKTMLAKALAKEANATFINIHSSAILSKWFGESNKMVKAIFSLALKLAPAIVFIDEAEALLGRRRDNEHEVSTQIKTEFMQLWDGLTTDCHAGVLVLAATNRPGELDEAVLRRFSQQYEVPLPDEGQREAILTLILKKHASENAQPAMDPRLLSNQPEAGSSERPLRIISRGCEGFSGSDLVELCSQAVSIPVHEALAAQRSGGTPNGMQPVSVSHFETVLRTFRPATQLATRAELASDPSIEQLIREMLINGLQQRMQPSDSQPDTNGRKAP